MKKSRTKLARNYQHLEGCYQKMRKHAVWKEIKAINTANSMLCEYDEKIWQRCCNENTKVASKA